MATHHQPQPQPESKGRYMNSRAIRHRILILFLLVSCEATSHRTSLSSWVRQPVKAMGIELELPPSIAKSIRHTSSTSVAWFFPAGVEDEDAYIIIIADRTTADELMREEINFANSHADAEFVRHTKWQGTLHPSTSRYDGTEYRRDVLLSTGGYIVRLQAFYTDFQFSAAERAEDAAAINRILSSARPMVTSSEIHGH